MRSIWLLYLTIIELHGWPSLALCAVKPLAAVVMPSAGKPEIHQCQHNGWANEVDVADVCEDLGRVEGELCEAEVGGNIGIRLIEDRWLDQTGARIDSED